MKLKDPGTIISSVVNRKDFLGKEYLLKVKYEESIGTDSWYFYFDPKLMLLKYTSFTMTKLK
jgi:hypothetical protein